jgi:hypothetical protein
MAALPVEPVPSVLPEEGLDLRAELERYKDWLIQQALVRTLGNVHAAAKLVRVSAETIYARTRDGRLGRVERNSEPVPVVAAPAAPDPPALTVVPAPPAPSEPVLTEPTPPARSSTVGIRRSDVARLRAQGMDPKRIARELMCSVYLVEKILSTPAPIAKCP